MTVIATVAQAPRQGTFVVVASARLLASHVGSLVIRAVINNADLASTTASLTMRLLLLNPVTQQFEHKVSGRWQGPSNPADPEQLPAIGLTITERLRGTDLRIEFDIPQQIRVGALVETL